MSLQYQKLTRKFIQTMSRAHWPMPQEAIDEIRGYIYHGDYQAIADSVPCRHLMVWDHLNRPRQKYRLSVMKAVLARAEMNQLSTYGEVKMTMLRDILMKLDLHYNTERYRDRLKVYADANEQLKPYVEFMNSLTSPLQTS